MAPKKKNAHGNNYLERGRKMSPVRQGLVGGTDRTSDVSPFDGETVGTTVERYLGLKDRMPVMPVSIWPVPMDRHQRDLRKLVGDEGQLRAESFMGGSFLPSEKGGRAFAASIFNPMLAAQLVQAYSQPGDLIIDPFAGGGTRAVIAGLMERGYVGIDVRNDEVVRVNQRLDDLGLMPGSLVSTQDAAQVDWPGTLNATSSGKRRKADMLLTCPPYWNLEVYSEDPADLSTKPTYQEFLDGIEQVAVQSKKGLKNGALAVWVVGEFRHPDNGELLDFPGDVARIHQRHGFWIYDRAVYTHANPQAFWRMGVFDKTRKLIRVHEHILVMKYGSPNSESVKHKGRARAGDGPLSWSNA